MNNYSIRRTFLLPLGLLLLLALLLFAVVLVRGDEIGKIAILGFMLLPISGLFFESFFRRLHFDTDTITVFKPFREKSLKFSELTEIDTLQVKKRVFLTLSTEEDFMILSNAYADFPQLVSAILEHAPDRVITDETRKMAADPPIKSSDIVSCWLGVVLLTIILALQFTQ